MRSSNKTRSKKVAQQLPTLRAFNTLTRRVEEFAPLKMGHASIYTCGPTVYRDAHIGNLRSYLMADWLRRFLEAQGISVRHVKNITDVGHMRVELLDRGEDKVLAAARAAGRTPAEIAEHYTDAFLRDEAKLNILPASTFPRATESIDGMIALAETLIERGFAYETNGNVYFDVASFPQYGKLSRRSSKDTWESDRVEPDPLKRDQRDFALWKAAEPGRELSWESPWGAGFPGWHIECSAMVREFLGERIDFHTGGVDNIFPHHEDEIAQSEAAFGQRHVQTWMHGQHLLVDGLKMAKSTGNVYLLSDLESRGFDPLAFRYLCANVHGRSRMNFTFTSLRAAQRGLDRLRLATHQPGGRATKKAEAIAEALRAEFWAAAAADLNIPAAMAVAWRVARCELPGALKRDLLLDFDRLLGLGLDQPVRDEVPPAELTVMMSQRHACRRSKDYGRADKIREKILALGYEVRDNGRASIAVASPTWKRDSAGISSSDDVPSHLAEKPDLEWTVAVVARRGPKELTRCVKSVKRWLGDRSAEVIVIDNGFDEDDRAEIGSLTNGDGRVGIVQADHFLGAGAGRNVALRQARGRYVALIDTSVEVKGDVFDRLDEVLKEQGIGIVGRWGAMTEDLRSFTEAPDSGDVHAVEGYLMAFRRDILRKSGWMDEKFRFYRHLDLDFSFAVRSLGFRAVIDTTLPVVKHKHVDWEATPAEERDRLSKRNYYRFLRKWEDRPDLAEAVG